MSKRPHPLTTFQEVDAIIRERVAVTKLMMAVAPAGASQLHDVAVDIRRGVHTDGVSIDDLRRKARALALAEDPEIVAHRCTECGGSCSPECGRHPLGCVWGGPNGSEYWMVAEGCPLPHDRPGEDHPAPGLGHALDIRVYNMEGGLITRTFVDKANAEMIRTVLLSAGKRSAGPHAGQPLPDMLCLQLSIVEREAIETVHMLHSKLSGSPKDYISAAVLFLGEACHQAETSTNDTMTEMHSVARIPEMEEWPLAPEDYRPAADPLANLGIALWLLSHAIPSIRESRYFDESGPSPDPS